MYLTFNLTITKIRLIAKYSAKIFDKFPKSMPCSIKNEYNDIHNDDNIGYFLIIVSCILVIVYIL